MGYVARVTYRFLFINAVYIPYLWYIPYVLYLPYVWYMPYTWYLRFIIVHYSLEKALIFFNKNPMFFSNLTFLLLFEKKALSYACITLNAHGYLLIKKNQLSFDKIMLN